MSEPELFLKTMDRQGRLAVMLCDGLGRSVCGQTSAELRTVMGEPPTVTVTLMVGPDFTVKGFLGALPDPNSLREGQDV